MTTKAIKKDIKKKAIKKEKPKKVENTKNKKLAIPFPKEGSWAEYFFWFVTTQTKSFISILVVAIVGLILLTIKISPVQDVNGDTHYTVGKEAIKLRTKPKVN